MISKSRIFNWHSRSHAATLNRLFRIKFGYLHAASLGHLALESDIAYIQTKSSKTYTFWITTEKIANAELLKLIAQRMRIIQNPFLRKILMPIVKATRGSVFDGNARVDDISSNIQDTAEISFPLNIDESDDLPNLLFSMGLNPFQKYVCLVVRDEMHSVINVSLDSAASTAYRNSNIEDFKKAIQLFIEAGYSVIRMGRNARICSFNIPGFFDYANSELRSDLNDLVLLSNCEFVFSTLSGVDEIANLYRKPVYIVNYLPIGFFRLSRLRPLILPKGLRDTKSGAKLSMKDILDRGLWTANSTEAYRHANVEIVDCNADEIEMFAQQVLSDFSKTLQIDDSDTFNEVQKFFVLAARVPENLKYKMPKISPLWLNYNQHCD